MGIFEACVPYIPIGRLGRLELSQTTAAESSYTLQFEREKHWVIVEFCSMY